MALDGAPEAEHPPQTPRAPTREEREKAREKKRKDDRAHLLKQPDLPQADRIRIQRELAEEQAQAEQKPAPAPPAE